jgi:hypothetical protein
MRKKKSSPPKTSKRSKKTKTKRSLAAGSKK